MDYLYYSIKAGIADIAEKLVEVAIRDNEYLDYGKM